jgi:nucleoside-diphosphate-sugar epimerase
MKTVLITGAAGFIGSNLSKHLAGIGWNVVGVDNLRSGRESNIDNIKNNFLFYNANILDDNKMNEIFKNHSNIEQIIHLAAIPRVSYSVENPLETNDTNVTGTLKILDLARKYYIKKVIFASSSSVYGGSKILPTPESITLAPKSPYALQKMIGEEYCKMYSYFYGLDTVSMRFFNIFGPNQYGDSPYASVISAFCQSIKDSKSPIIYGDGSFFRDFTYIDNVVDFIVKASNHSKPLNGEVFNVGCGKKTSINDLVKMMNALPPKHFEERVGDVPCSQADISKAKEILGYTPLVDIEDGLKETINWYIKNTD